MSRRLTHAGLAVFLAASLAVSPLYAQNQTPAPDAQSQTQPQVQAPPVYQPPTPTPNAPPAPSRSMNFGPDYSHGHSWFPNIAAPYTPLQVAKPDFVNTPRIDQLISNGKLNLSLEDALSLALENNLSVAVSRYTPWLDEANLLLSQSGSNGRLTFDPVFSGNADIQLETVPINNPFFAGIGATSTTSSVAPGLVDHNVIADFTYTQNFHLGTQFQVTWDNERTFTNFGGFDLFNPYVQSSLTAQVTQPLLNGFGTLVNTRYILEAKNTVRVGESQFEQQVMTIITQVATDYWELVFARENVKVEQVAVAADQQLYENNKKQLEIGTMAPLDVITAQSQLASDQQALVQAQTTQLLDETTLLVAVTKNPLAMQLNGIEIVPTTTLYTPAAQDISLDDAVKEAWQKRPELQQAALNLKNAGIEVKATRNLLLPQLNLVGQYQASGLGGNVSVTSPTGTFLGSPDEPIFSTSGEIPAGATPIGFVATPLTSVTSITPSGLGKDLRTMIQGQYPTIEGGLTFNLPIRNRAAQAQNATAQLNEREQEVQYQQTQSTIVLNVRQALITLVQDRAAISAAEEARILAQQSYDDEVKRLQLGSSTAFTVIQKQQLLTAAEGTELRDRINLIEAQLNFEQAMGRTLEVHNITMSDAMKGSITNPPNIPGTPTTGPATHQ